MDDKQHKHPKNYCALKKNVDLTFCTPAEQRKQTENILREMRLDAGARYHKLNVY